MTTRSLKPILLPARLAILATLFWAGFGVAATVPDQCIVGESVFGCRSERDIAQITATYHGDADALREMIAADLSSGVCQMFRQGERVFSAGVAGDAERTAVRRSGDEAAYWMPASWSRPVDECRAYPAPRLIAGNAAVETAHPSGELMPINSTRGPSFAGQSGGCVFKPVMSDAEIAACKSSDRE
ncbi:MAG TPA: hypothetical protein VGH81_09445 [Rudaea sp.]|jgi:hypothetical protein